jgi:hypothetical protein
LSKCQELYQVKIKRSKRSTTEIASEAPTAGAPDTVQCTGWSAKNLLLSGITKDVVAKIHRTVRWCTGLSGEPTAPEPTVSSTISGRRITHGQSQRSLGCTGLSGVPRGPRVQWSASPEKERNQTLFMSGGASDYTVSQLIEGKNCLPNGDPTTPSCFGSIKGTPRRMEQYMKPPLNILRRLDSASTHLDHCV